MEQLKNQQIITEKKKWETPKAEVCSVDSIKSGGSPSGAEGAPTMYNHTNGGFYNS